jgi:hypothetical protein
MRRGNDRSSEMQGDQVSQQSSATGPGTTAGAAATGGSGTGRETEGPYTTTGTQTYQRGGQQPAGYGRTGHAASGGYGRSSGMETGASTAQGGLFLVLAGLLTFLAGLAFVVRHGFYVSHGLYAYNWGIESWGWVLFGLGIVTFAVGACHLLGLPFSRPVGIAMAVLTTVAGFMIVPFYVVWGIIIVGLGLAAMWGLAHGAERRDSEQRVDEYERERQRM